jgi:hypothetical protein
LRRFIEFLHKVIIIPFGYDNLLWGVRPFPPELLEVVDIGHMFPAMIEGIPEIIIEMAVIESPTSMVDESIPIPQYRVFNRRISDYPPIYRC